jgi:acyl carrier protein
MSVPASVDEFVRNFEGAVEGVAPNSLTPDADFHDLEQWDSLAALSVLAMIDGEYETEISGNELRRCKTLGDLYTIIQSKN